MVFLKFQFLLYSELQTCRQGKGGELCEEVAWKRSFLLPQHHTNVSSNGRREVGADVGR